MPPTKPLVTLCDKGATNRFSDNLDISITSRYVDYAQKLEIKRAIHKAIQDLGHETQWISNEITIQGPSF
jgi:hypothetical protein